MLARLPRPVRYLLQILFVVAATGVANFFLLKLVPGDLVDVIAAENSGITPAHVAELRQAYGLDQGVLSQLGYYLKSLASLDLGYSFRYGEPVADLILGRLPATLALIGTGLALSVALGVLLGVLAARRPHGLLDTLLSGLATAGYSAPMFWTALMLIVGFGVHLDWLPVGGIRDVGAAYSGGALWLDYARHLVLPVATVAIYYIAIYARLSRASMIETLQEDYIRTARARGNGEARVIWRHALRNAILPVATMLGLQSSALLGGSIVVETVFAWPGLGQLSFEAIASRDVNLLLGILLMSAALVAAMNIVVDACYGLLDPRVRKA